MKPFVFHDFCRGVERSPDVAGIGLEVDLGASHREAADQLETQTEVLIATPLDLHDSNDVVLNNKGGPISGRGLVLVNDRGAGRHIGDSQPDNDPGYEGACLEDSGEIKPPTKGFGERVYISGGIDQREFAAHVVPQGSVVRKAGGLLLRHNRILSGKPLACQAVFR
jgi:hypothetical protein